MTDHRAALERALDTISRLRTALEEQQRPREPIAVIGVGCRFPGDASSPEAFWQLLRCGTDAIGPFPKERWDSADFYDPDPEAPGKAYTLDGGYVSDINDFDASLFGLSPAEALGMDPQQRQVLEVSWEALERAGIAPDSLTDTRTGVYLGASTSDYVRLRQQYADLDTVDAYQLLGEASFIAGRVAFTLGLQGPAEVVDTACSSSLVALHNACQALWSGQIDLALAGGVNAILSPYGFVLLSKARAIAPDGRCKAFDAAANGYGRGEGCGMVVLKRLADARAAGDEVLAVVHGAAVNHDGRSSGITVPNGNAQRAVIAEALADAGVAAGDIDYVEAHGTGTVLGDPIELRALQAEIGAHRPVDQPLLIGSVKTNIGHLEAGAGIAGLIKTVLALSHREIPPSLHFQNPNPNLDWNGLRVRVATEVTPWPAERRYAGLSSFGASGTNVHVVLGSAPQTDAEPLAAPPAEQPAGVSLLTLSAKSRGALRDLAGRYAGHLGSSQDELAALCRGADAGRARHPHRLAVAATTTAALADSLNRFAQLGEVDEDAAAVGSAVPRHRLKPALLFPGQGAQYPRMGMELYDAEPVFRSVLQECDELLRPELGRSLIDLLRTADAGSLEQTQFTQPALFAVEYAMARLLESCGVRPYAVIGHSVGEYTAACVAGVLALPDALRLLALRARLMQELPEPGAMLALRASEQFALQVIGKRDGLALAAVNGPEDVVVSGGVAQIEQLAAELAGSGVTARRLRVSHAFHSPLVDPMVEQLRAAAAEVPVSSPTMLFAANLTGELVGPDTLPDAGYWAAHARGTVRFAAGVQAVADAGASCLVEAGPGRTLIGLAAGALSADASLPLIATMRRGRPEARQVRLALGTLHVHGVPLDSAAVHGTGRQLRSALPTYAFQHQTYAFQPQASAFQPQASATRPDDGGLSYRVEWRALPAPVAPESAGNTLVLARSDGDSADLAKVLASRLAARDGHCRVVAADGDLASLLAEEPAVDRVLYLGALDATVAEVDEHVLAVVRLVRALTEADGQARLWLATRDAQRTGPADRVSGLACAPLIGLGKVIALEQPAVWGGQLDLDRTPSAADADELVAAMLGTGDDDETALRDGRRLAPRLARWQPPDRTPRIRPEAAYLITGGLGGLGLKIAEWLADQGATHIALTGRAGLPAPSDDPSHDPAVDARRAAVEALRARGVEVAVAAVDVCDSAAMADLVTAITSQRPLAGVVHAAGLAGPADLLTLDESVVRDVLRPKVRGGWVLHQVTADQPLDFFLCMSSIASVWGSAHLAAYAAANQFLDALAGHRQASDRAGLAVNWGPWLVASGLGGEELLDRLTANGLRALDPDVALALLGTLIASEQPQVVVSGVDWPVLRPLLEARSARPLLSDLPGGAAAPDPDEAPSEILAAVLAAPDAERIGMLDGYLRNRIAGQLGVEPDDLRGAQVSLVELGLDSLGVINLLNRMSRDLRLTLTARVFFEVPAIEWAQLLHGEIDAQHGLTTERH